MKKLCFKRTLSILLSLILMLSLMPATVLAADGDVTLTILHVNDRHGRMGADPYISQLAKDTTGNVLILDAGDALHGQITANLSKGAAMVELMNAVGYSAMVAGNHEFTYSTERMAELAEMMDFPLLAANVKDADGETLFQDCVVFEMDGITVGVFGLATPETVASSDPRLMAGLVFDDPVTTALAEVAELKAAGCDIIIALTHMGLDDLSDPANRSDTLAKVDGIDVIIDGHSHTALENGLTIGNTLIAQTGEYGENIGVVEITVSGGKVSKTAKLLPVPSDGETSELTADEAIVSKIAQLDEANEAVTSVVVGYTPVFLQGEKAASRTGETNLADLITDSMRYATGADMAFLTGGNIRASMDAGDITMGEVLTTLPYSNLLTTVELTGADIVKVLEHGVALYPEAVGQYIHVSGLSFHFDPNAEAGSRVKSVTMMDGTALRPDQSYTVATIDFIAAGGDGYDMMKNGQNQKYYGGDAEAFVDYLATQPTINAEPEHRVCAIQEKALHVVMPDATHGFLAESIRHAEDELQSLAANTGLVYELHKTADAGEQAVCIDEAIRENAGAIVLWPVTGEPLREAAQRVMDAGIPLILYDRLIEDFQPDSEVLGDNTKIAQMAGAYFNGYFADEIASGETIGILELAGDDSTVPVQRTQGFMELAGNNVSVIERFDTQWQRENTRVQVSSWLETASVAEIESVQAIYAHEDETVLGAMDAIAAYNGPAKLNIRLVIGLGGKRDLLMNMGFYKNHFGIDLVTYAFSPAMIREAINDGARAAAGEMPHQECLIDTIEIDCNTVLEYLASEMYETRYTTALPSFDDVSENAWYCATVSGMAIEGYMGTGGTFEPNAPVTEEEACELLRLLLPYADVPHRHGETILTREVLAVMLDEALDGYLPHDDEGEFSYADAAEIQEDCLSSVMCVYNAGLMRGVGGGRFDPKGIVTRAQMASVMSNVMNTCLTAANDLSESGADALKPGSAIVPHLSDTDYSDENNWLSFGGDMSQDVDVFMIYPTVTQSMDDADRPYVRLDSDLMHMAAAGWLMENEGLVSGSANIYAPFYQQLNGVELESLSSETFLSHTNATPRDDIFAAFDYYLTHVNKGERPFILLGNSQGGQLVTELSTTFLGSEKYYKHNQNLIIAYAIGVTVTEDQIALNPNLKFSQSATDTGVLVSWNTTSSSEVADGVYQEFGTWRPGALVTNPITWTTDETPADAASNKASLVFAEDGTPKMAENYANAIIDKEHGVLLTTSVDEAIYTSMSSKISKLHRYDIAFFYGSIQQNIKDRIAAFMS